jgi:glycosylphosphatidylinositol transamidase (GPIT) subunit GPI8
MSDARLKVLTLSQRMLICAEQARWDELSQLESEFQPLIEDYFAKVDDLEAKTLSKQLLEQNQQIQKHIKRAQKRILDLQTEETRNMKAMHSYLKTE